MRRRILNPLAVASEGAARLPQPDIDRVRRVNADALEQLRTGSAGDQAMAKLSYALLLADKLARIGPLARANRDKELQAGADALTAITLREQRIGRAVATGPELEALRDALAVHQVQIAHCTRLEYEKADAAIQARRAQVCGTPQRGA